MPPRDGRGGGPDRNGVARRPGYHQFSVRLCGNCVGAAAICCPKACPLPRPQPFPTRDLGSLLMTSRGVAGWKRARWISVAANDGDTERPRLNLADVAASRLGFYTCSCMCVHFSQPDPAKPSAARRGTPVAHAADATATLQPTHLCSAHHQRKL